MSASAVMEYLKGKNTLLIFDRYAGIKCKCDKDSFGCYRLYTVVKNTKSVYSKSVKKDRIYEQLSL